MSDDAPRLFLVTPLVTDAAAFKPLLEAAVNAADIACVLLRTAGRQGAGSQGGEPDDDKAIIRALAPVAQARGAAVLVEGDVRLAARLDVDGVHLGAGTGAANTPLAAALTALQPKKIVGIGGFSGRDAAMQAGETGVDYVMFGFPGGTEDADAVLDQVEWWAELFNVPCVGYAAHLDGAAAVARAGAEFVALCEGLWDAPDTLAARLRAVAAAIVPVPEATP